MYLSVGNLANHAQVGMLFIDFETPRRLRVQGIASIDESADKLGFPGAEFLIRIKPTAIWVNCPRYIHSYKKLEDSPYTPSNHSTERIAQWKRLDSVVDSLSEKDRVVALESGLISLEDYNLKIKNKDG